MVAAPIVLFALTIHEFMHAWTAYKLGDPTAKAEGRITLNPISHLDPMGTICLLLTQRFGWARPVPINPLNFRNPVRDSALVSLAGPASNLCCAFVCGMLFRAIMAGALGAGQFAIGAATFIRLAVLINIGLGLFNLIPLAPLDGSHILEALLPAHSREGYRRFSAISPYILFGLLMLEFWTGKPLIIGLVLLPPLRFLASLFAGLPA